MHSTLPSSRRGDSGFGRKHVDGTVSNKVKQLHDKISNQVSHVDGNVPTTVDHCAGKISNNVKHVDVKVSHTR